MKSELGVCVFIGWKGMSGIPSGDPKGRSSGSYNNHYVSYPIFPKKTILWVGLTSSLLTHFFSLNITLTKPEAELHHPLTAPIEISLQYQRLMSKLTQDSVCVLPAASPYAPVPMENHLDTRLNYTALAQQNHSTLNDHPLSLVTIILILFSERFDRFVLLIVFFLMNFVEIILNDKM